MEFVHSLCWGVDRCVGYGFGSAYGITFGIDDGSDMGYYDGSRGGISVSKYVKDRFSVIIYDS